MKRGSNDDQNEGGVSSIRLKYKKGGSSKSKINYGVVMKSSKHEFSEGGSGGGVKEEKIIIKKESKLNRGIAASPQESSSKITTKTVVQGGESGNSRSKVTITKTEIKSESQKGGNESKGSRITSKTTEITTSSTMNASGSNRNGSQGRKVREEITTKTMTTTSNQGGRGLSSGKNEIVKTVTNQVSEGGSSQRKVRGGREETTTTTTTTTTNLRSGNQGRSSQKGETTSTTTKTTTTNQRSTNRAPSQGQQAKVVKEVITETSVNRRNSGTQGTKTTTKTVTTAQGQGRVSSRTKDSEVRTTQKTLVNQKSTPALRVSNQVTSKTALKDTSKRPLSSTIDINSNRDNIVRITIDETGKIPKKTYVLNVRKLDRIQQDKRQRLTYSNKMDEKEALQTNFNNNIIVIQNITKEAKKLDPNISNIAQIVINESGKIPKKQVQVSPRKNEVIRSVKKPLKLTYENYVETNTTNSINTKKGINKIPLPSTSKKMELKTSSRDSEQKLKSRGNSSQKIETETKSSRIRNEGGKQTTTTTTKTTTTTETNTRIGRNKSEANMNKGGSSETKVTITKTKMTSGGKKGKFGQLEITSGNGKSSKVETVTTKQVLTERSGSKSRSGGEGASGSKVTTVKKTEVSYGSNGKDGNSRVKQESSTTTTTTKTVTKTSSKLESGGEGGGSVVRKFKSMRRMKK